MAFRAPGNRRRTGRGGRGDGAGTIGPEHRGLALSCRTARSGRPTRAFRASQWPAGKAYAGGRFTSVRPPGSPLGHQRGRPGLPGRLRRGHRCPGRLVRPGPRRPGVRRGRVGRTARGFSSAATSPRSTASPGTGSPPSTPPPARWSPTWKPRLLPGQAIAVSGDDTVYFGGSFGLVNGRTVSASPRSPRTSARCCPGHLRSTATCTPWTSPTTAPRPTPAASSAGQRHQPEHRRQPRPGDRRGASLPGRHRGPAAERLLHHPGRVDRRQRRHRVFGNGGDGGGCFDGTWAVDIPTNTLKWKNQCLGATEAVKFVNGWLYKASHAHDCANQGAGGFPQGFGYRFLLNREADRRHARPVVPEHQRRSAHRGRPAGVRDRRQRPVGRRRLHHHQRRRPAGSDPLHQRGPGAAPAKPAKLHAVQRPAGCRADPLPDRASTTTTAR